MSEREMREALRKVCDDLELEARAEARKRGRKLVYPLMVGAGLLMVNCDDETDTDPAQPAYMAPSGSPTATQTGSGSGTTTGTATGGGGEGGTTTGAAGSGGAGGATGGGPVGGGAVGGAQMDYMAPDA